MGVFTREGRVVASMRDKYRQINRFLELVEDALRTLPSNRPLRILDFGCGKSYLTFVLYDYFAVRQGRPLQMVGLDLKADVIARCN
ncbi:MAG: methyltransferase, partial [Clostridia bacterium]|nr:methyltransferase [Clostridia bacterium]